MKYSAILFDYGKTLSGDQTGDWTTQMIRELFESGYRLGIVSNSCRYGDYRWLRKHLSDKKWSEYFEVVVGSGGFLGRLTTKSGLSCEKPNLDIYIRTLGFLGLINHPQRVVFVGDTLDADILGPSTLGMSALLVNADIATYNTELWQLLDDNPSIKRPNVLTEYLYNGVYITTPLKHLTEPLYQDERIIAGVTEFIVKEWNIPHIKENILDDKSNHRVYINIKVGEIKS